MQLGEVGSAGVAAAVSRGEPLELFWILDDIGAAEALVAKNGSGINSVANLKGKKIAVPFNSTTHFHTIVALEQAKVNPADVQILNMRPPKVRGGVAARRHPGDVHLGPGAGRSQEGRQGHHHVRQDQRRHRQGHVDGYVVNKDSAKRTATSS